MSTSTANPMLKNYFKTAWRNLIKNGTFSTINILGLALGLASSMLIMLWVLDEQSIDTQHTDGDLIFTIIERLYYDGVVEAHRSTPGLLGHEMRTVLPEVEYASGFAWNSLTTFEVNGKILKEDGNFAGEDFFKIFNYALIEGKPADALKTPQDIAVSRKMAEDFFGSPAKAIGQAIRFQNEKDLKITAVFENISLNSSRRFDFIGNWETFLDQNRWARDWGNSGPNTFIKLKRGSDIEAFRKKIKSFIELYNKEENLRIELDIQKYSDEYLNSNFKSGEISGGRIQYVRLFSVVAVFILFIGCINFMNLTTAKSFKRSKEIGVRKVVGAARGALIRQFMSEALWIVALSFILAIVIVALILPRFNSMVQKEIGIPVSNIYFWFTLLILTAVTGVIAGSYPALYLSSFNPVKAFRGSLKFSSATKWFRKGLVVFQFVLSIMLIIGTIVITGQVRYIQSSNLGYDRENLLYVPLEGNLADKYDIFKKECLRRGAIEYVSRSTQNPTSIINGTWGLVWEGKDPSAKLQFVHTSVGFDFVNTMRLKLVDGRDFSHDFITDSVAYIVNEAAVKVFNYKDPVGMPLTFWERPGKIVGVLKDFHFRSLHTAIDPIVLRLGEAEHYGMALIRTKPGKTREAIANVERVWKEMNPQFPFTYQFSDEEYQKLYQSEEVISELSNVFAALAIFISCLGLLGLAIFTSEQKTKEVGIRKILGASLGSLFNLLSREIMLMVSAALLIASPLAWYVMDTWLGEYAYRIPLTWQMFVLAGLAAILIALITISFQTIKALLANPVTSLRND